MPADAAVSRITDPAEYEAKALAPAVVSALDGGGEGTVPQRDPVSTGALLSGSPSDRVGATLKPAVRARLQAATGIDPSPVRIHSDSDGGQAAERLGAAAFAYGPDIWFAEGRLDTSSTAGRDLIAHELVHAGMRGLSRTVHRQVAGNDTLPRARTPVRSGPGSRSDPVVLIELARRTGSAVMMTRSGARIEGHATDLDLDVGAYQLVPHPAQHIWTIIGSRGGQHFTLLIEDLTVSEGPTASEDDSDAGRPLVDAFTVVYDQPVLRVVPGAEPEAAPVAVNLDDVFRQMNGILNLRWVHGGDEELLITMIESVPAPQSGEFLRRLSLTRSNGDTWLEDLDDRISGDNNEHLHQALSMQRIRATPEQSIAALANAPVLPWHDVMGFFEDAATFTSERSGPGKVRIRYFGGTRIMTSTDFGDEIRRLPLDIFIGGVEYDDNQPLIIHDYDSGQFLTVVASELAGYEHLGVRNFLSHVATVASFAIPVSAAESVAGRVFVVTLERVLPAAFLLVDENRINLVHWFPNWGPKMIQYSDTLKTAAAAVGFARLALSGFEMFRQWRAIARSRQTIERAVHLDADAQRVAGALERQAETAYRQAERARDAEAAHQAGAAAAGDAADVQASSGIRATTEGPTQPAASQRTAPAPSSTGGAAATPAPAAVAWQGINDETRSMLQGSPQLREALEDSPLAAEVLKFCHSLCYPRFVTEAQIRRLETALERAQNLNVAVNEGSVQRALHSAATAEDLDHVVAQIETRVATRVQVGQDLEETGGVAGPAPAEAVGDADEGFYLTDDLRNVPGRARGGARLSVRQRLIEPAETAEEAARLGRPAPSPATPQAPGTGIGPMPGQIAARLRAYGPFRNFRQFREVFWQMVAQDPQLNQGWTPSNLTRMRAGLAPRVGRLAGIQHATGGGVNAVLQLNHIREIANAGGLYDLDNLEIVTPLVHQALGR